MKPGQKIAKALEQRNIPHSALLVLGMKQPNISRFLNGHRDEKRRLQKIADIADVPMDWVMDPADTEVPPRSRPARENQAMVEMRREIATLLDCITILAGRVLELERSTEPQSAEARSAREERAAGLEQLLDRLESAQIGGKKPAARTGT